MELIPLIFGIFDGLTVGKISYIKADGRTNIAR